MAPVSHGTSACASSTFAPPTTNKIGAMGAMVPAYFSMTPVVVYVRRTHDGTLASGVQATGQTMRHVSLPVVMWFVITFLT